MLRSTGAVLAGFLLGGILSVATDMLLHAAGIFPPWGQPMSDELLLLATAYRIVFNVAGCYLAARLAPDRPMLHALVIGIVGVAVGTVGAVTTWDRGPAFGPHWYPVAVIAVSIPCAWAGGKIRDMQLRALAT
jgi:hypothetical protein